jgi:hypothetical protein
MAHADGTKSGGKMKGSRNKSTLAKLAAIQEAANAMKNPDGSDVFQGDAYALLVAIYKNEIFPIDVRMQAAKEAAQYERPRLSAVDNTIHEPGKYIVRMPSAVGSLEEWGRMAAPVFVEAEKAENEFSH